MAPNVQLRSCATETNEEKANGEVDPFIVNKSPCSLDEHLKKVNCKRNPSCIFGLGENSSEGVLQVDKIAKRLYESVLQGRKTEEISFAGLRNLGATCYANVVLQLLFFLRPFREAILNADTDLLLRNNLSKSDTESSYVTESRTHQLERSIVELQLLFATLLKGHTSCVSPKKFLEALDLTTFVEQDIQEFVNLLLSLVEKYFQNSTTKRYDTLISDLFQGTRRYVTTCHYCGQISEASKTGSRFTELQVAAYQVGGIEDALSSMVMEEILSGDNQYFCEFCNGKRDASRKIVFDKLPPVLMLQLLRTSFDLTSGEKKKTHAKISFPLEADFHQLLGVDTANEAKTYRLKAVCFHRGSSAYCGHYTIRLFDDSSNKWYEFDDAQVKMSNSLDGPFVANPRETASNNERRKRAKLAPETCTNTSTLSSTNACLLVYVLNDPLYCFGDLEKSNLPDVLQDTVDSENADLNSAFQSEKSSVDSKIAEMERRKSEYLDLLPKLPATMSNSETSDSVSYGYVPTSWLKEWVRVREESIKPIDCSPFICEHGGLNPESVFHVKRIGLEAFNWMIEKYGSNSPQLKGPQCHCMICVNKMNDTIANAEFWKKKNDEFISYLIDPKDILEKDATTFYVEKQFFKQWKKLSLTCKQGVEFMRKLEKLLKECAHSRYCVHEKLVAEEWKAINADVGKHLYDLLQFISRISPICVDYFIFCEADSNLRFCDDCREKLVERKEEISSYRQSKRLEKASLGELLKPRYQLELVRFLVQQMKKWQELSSSSDAWNSSESRYLISLSWFQSWSDYINNDGKRPDTSPLEDLVCEHNMLSYDLVTADDIFDRRVLCVSADCWQEIVKAYGSYEGVKVELSQVDGNCKGMFSLPSCHSCMKKRKSLEDKNEIELVLIKVNDLEEIKDKKNLSLDSLELYSTCIKSEMMTSRRSRVLRIRCSPSNSISELKLIIFQFLDIAPAAQELYLGKEMNLVQSSVSLKDYNISDGTLLFLYIDKSKLDHSEEEFCALPEESKVEVGFVGSQLLGL